MFGLMVVSYCRFVLGINLASVRYTSTLMFVFFVFVATSLSGISSNYQIGFGTFVDKNVFPYTPQVNVIDAQGNCKTFTRVCEPVHSFRHILSLTENEDTFSVSEFVKCCHFE